MSSYQQHVAGLERRLAGDQALKVAVGGEFVAMGKLEYHLLRSRGLRDDDLVIDVGCGSGRLACHLAPFPRLRYIGCDVVPRLLAHAESLCQRPDWRFVHTAGTSIPGNDNTADIVCFFSVFTHLTQEDIFRYFRETRRVLKPGGLMVMSFLEFAVTSHWRNFIASVEATRDDTHLNQFVERDAIKAWAAHAGLEVCAFHAGDTSYIPLPEEIRLENGDRMADAGSLGQSVAILRRPPDATSETASSPAPPVSVPRLDARPLPSQRPAVPVLNVSNRANIRAGETMITGFVIGGDASRRVLIRALGPTLRIFGVPDPMLEPTLEVRAGESRVTTEPATPTQLTAAAMVLGAPALPAGSQEPARLVSLQPGAYTLLVSPAAGTKGGAVLVEIFYVD